MNNLILGAYAAAPPGLESDTQAENRWYSLLRDAQNIGGLELPFFDTLHSRGVKRLAALLDQRWSCVVTTIPGTVQRIKENPAYGLASDNRPGREAAVGDLHRAYEQIRELRAIAGPASVQAIQIHSAPSQLKAPSSVLSFTRSLTEISSWDWEGIRLGVEHCDAAREGVEPQKGFLSLAGEIEAAQKAGRVSGRHIGHTINWARSAIERRDVEAPAAHLALLNARQVLTGLMFSGVSAIATDYGEAWADTHLPVDTGGQPSSLLSAEQIRTCTSLAGTASYVGVKVAADPLKGATQEQRLAPARATVAQVVSALQPRQPQRTNADSPGNRQRLERTPYKQTHS